MVQLTDLAYRRGFLVGLRRLSSPAGTRRAATDKFLPSSFFTTLHCMHKPQDSAKHSSYWMQAGRNR